MLLNQNTLNYHILQYHHHIHVLLINISAEKEAESIHVYHSYNT